MRLLGPTIVSAALLAGCAGQEPETARSATARSGVETMIGNSSQYNSNCQTVRIPPVTIVEAPQHGTIDIRPTTVTRRSGGRIVGADVCSGREVEAAGIFYQSAAGYHGPDRVRYSVYLPGSNGRPGNTLPSSVTITVR